MGLLSTSAATIFASCSKDVSAYGYTLKECYSGEVSSGKWDPLDSENSVDDVPKIYTTMCYIILI